MHHHSRFRITVGLAALAGICGASAAHAQAVFNQPYTTAGSYTSQNDTAPGGFGHFDTVYDDFKLASSADIGYVTWIGAYSNGNLAEATGFTLNFYSDNAGGPNTLLQTNTIVGTADETPMSLDVHGNQIEGYDYKLPSAFSASAGTKYWMSIVADLPITNQDFGPNWGWELGSGGNNISSEFGSPQPGDMSFSLTPSDTPEPGSFALLAGVGMTGVACIRRRRARKSTPIA